MPVGRRGRLRVGVRVETSSSVQLEVANHGDDCFPLCPGPGSLDIVNCYYNLKIQLEVLSSSTFTVFVVYWRSRRDNNLIIVQVIVVYYEREYDSEITSRLNLKPLLFS